MADLDAAADAASAPPASPPAIALTANAARRIRQLRELEGNPALMLRIAVSGGGCSGFQYGFSFDTEAHAEDLVFERDGVRVVVDDVSMDLLGGAELDFVEDLMGAYFKLDNPNAKSTCGCGTSFAV
ncbi:MAG TPA: iron-sulfur cluster insertion protein ErpA [Alphaproteobacteria bacterium]|nr:iron-sulfur cluster insertion protein ErpA [Alphaproteobacteria bacterium]